MYRLHSSARSTRSTLVPTTTAPPILSLPAAAASRRPIATDPAPAQQPVLRLSSPRSPPWTARRCALPGSSTETLAPGTSDGRTIRVHYVRRDRRYTGWGLHTWGDVTQSTQWDQPLLPVGLNQDCIWWEVELKPGAHFLGLLVHEGEAKAARAEVHLTDLGHSSEVWLAGDEQRAFMGGAPDITQLPVGTLGKQEAIWVAGDVIAWRHALHDSSGPRTFHLHLSSKGHMWINGDGVQNTEAVFELEPLAPQLPPQLAQQWPHLAGCAALRLPRAALDQVDTLFRGQLAVSCTSAQGVVLCATGLQLQGGLDAYCTYDGPLGVFTHPETKRLCVAVWAPTAQSVQLLHYKDARGGHEAVLPMQLGAMGRGVWSAELPEGALWSYYKYRVSVYNHITRRVEVCDATDPYSRSLAADGERTQVVPPDLNHSQLAPDGWQAHAVPPFLRWTDISIYELHIRDFSSEDTSVVDKLRGKYLAFVPEVAAKDPSKGTAGLNHLAALKEAGLTHLHLLPTYDFGSVPERPEEQAVIKEDLRQHPPDSDRQQSAVLAIADQDAFNWGYDPVHYGVPEGSYATDPDGAPRVKEFRQMVMSLHQQGWRVVLDVVYNHVFAAGPHSRYSVLDKIVPGYYQRRLEDGDICHSTCCNNTATEHAMCERLVVDDIVHWATTYKIDGFRFDIMGHLMLRTLQRMRARLDELTPETHGVDGKRIYIYGEAWDFGEVMDNARGVNCGQMNLSGTGLGAFNDRLRDGALGGGPFMPYDFQGLVTGLSLTPNGCRGQGDSAAQAQELLVLSDWVRYSLAGNLRQYKLLTASGEVLRGEEAQAHGQPLAYGGMPCEHVAFIGCHDNLTMFDFITEKAPLTAPADERARMQMLCLGLIILSQGIPFIHAGDDLLRSKSLDRDSYNSGDWFNGVDWTGNTHKLGIGLPVHTKNGHNWGHKRPLLANPLIKPTPDMLHATTAVTQQLLRIRYSSPLFRLPSTQAVCQQVHFHNTGPQQVPGLIVMELVSAPTLDAGSQGVARDGSDVQQVYDPRFDRLVVVANASPSEQDVPYPPYAGNLDLHPEQAAPDAADVRARACTADNGRRVLHVLPRTLAVYVQSR